MTLVLWIKMFMNYYEIKCLLPGGAPWGRPQRPMKRSPAKSENMSTARLAMIAVIKHQSRREMLIRPQSTFATIATMSCSAITLCKTRVISRLRHLIATKGMMRTRPVPQVYACADRPGQYTTSVLGRPHKKSHIENSNSLY
jgi:hypothetical protein